MELARIFDESVSWSVTKQKIFSLRVAGRFNNDKPTTSPKTYALMNIAVDWTTKYLLSISHLKLFNQWILRYDQYLQSPHSIFAVGVIISPVFDFMLERDFKRSNLYLLSIEIHKLPRKCHTSRNQLVEKGLCGNSYWICKMSRCTAFPGEYDIIRHSRDISRSFTLQMLTGFDYRSSEIVAFFLVKKK